MLKVNLFYKFTDCQNIFCKLNQSVKSKLFQLNFNESNFFKIAVAKQRHMSC